jgi:hypothetical protein
MESSGRPKICKPYRSHTQRGGICFKRVGSLECHLKQLVHSLIIVVDVDVKKEVEQGILLHVRTGIYAKKLKLIV